MLGKSKKEYIHLTRREQCKISRISWKIKLTTVKKKKKKKKKTNLKRPVNKGEKILLFSLQKKNLTVKLKTVNFLSGLYAIAAYRDPQC